MEQTKQKESKKTLRTFALASFLNDMGSDMIYPIWPLFIKNVLGADMAILGLIDGLGDAIVSISQAVSGYVSDKIKRRKIFIWIGYLFGAISRIGYALAATWQFIIPFRILDRAGKMRGAPRDAILAENSTDQNRGRNFGLLRAMDNLGAVTGIVICILLFDYLGYKNIFLLAFVPSIIATLLIIFFIKEKSSNEIKIYKGLSFRDLSRNFKLFMFLSAIFSLGSFSYSFLLVYANDFGFKTAFVPFLYLLFTAVASLFSLPFGKLSDKIGRKNVMLISFLLWGVTCFGFIFANSFILIILSFLLYGLHKAAIDTVQRAYVSELSPQAYRASSLGGFQMVIGLCALPSSLIAGLLWDNIGTNAPFYFSVALTLIAGLLAVFIKQDKGNLGDLSR